jgi:hypothetical protein
VPTTIKLRRGTAAQWTTADPVLAAGEPGHETDTGKHKIGDGSKTWSQLEYFLPESALSATIATAQEPVKEELRAVQSSPDYFTTTRPIVTFVTDDGDSVFFDIMGTIATEKNIEVSVAAVAGYTSGQVTVPGRTFMDWDDLRTVKAAGHDVLNHGYAHLVTYDAGVTTAALDADYALSVEMFADNLPEAPEAQQVLVYSGGLGATEVAKKGIARKHFDYAVTTSAPIGASSGNREPVDQFGVYRFNLDTGTEAAAKAAIDSAVALGTWLVFMVHDEQLDTTGGGRAAQMTKVRNVIDYAVAQGVPIMKFTDAEKIKGNAISIGEYTDQGRSTVISRRGARRHTGAQGSWTPRLYGSTTPGVHTYTQQKGYYQVTGGMVTVKASISITAANLDAAMAGNLRIDGLPAAFMPNTLDVAAVAPCNYNIFNLGTNYTTVWAKSGGAYLNLLRGGNNVAEAFLGSAQVVAGQTLNLAFVMTYMLSGDPAWV